MPKTHPDFSGLEKALGYAFKNKADAADALTHSSMGEKNYERLEFLGDRVLALIIAETLLDKYPAEKEGDLAKRLSVLVQGEVLAAIAAEIGIGQYIHFSAGEREAGAANSENVLSDALEALLGAVYLDRGLEPCRTIIATLWSERFDNMPDPPQHPKAQLQEWAQGRGLPLPEYKISGQKGPDHAPVFSVQLTVRGFDPVIAEGRSRQAAEKEAARLFLESADA
ncbi:MAG: ribonuclease III [Alphaproteobacteria bacterium]